MSERDLYPLIKDHFKEYVFFEEVPFFENRIDLFGIKMRSIVCIDVKIRNIKRAFEQAMLRQLITNDVYIAMLFGTFISDDLRSQIMEEGIGVIGVDFKENNCYIAIEPKGTIRREYYFNKYMELYGETGK